MSSNPLEFENDSAIGRQHATRKSKNDYQWSSVDYDKIELTLAVVSTYVHGIIKAQRSQQSLLHERHGGVSVVRSVMVSPSTAAVGGTVAECRSKGSKNWCKIFTITYMVVFT